MEETKSMSLFDFSYEFPNSIEEIDAFNGKQFEVFLFRFFKELGYEPRMTDDTNDKGIDLTIHIPNENGSKKVGIQAKRWKSPVGSDEIRTMLDGKKHYNLDEVWIITTSKLTSSAITTAMNNSIEILTRDHVITFLEELKSKPNIKFRPLKSKGVNIDPVKQEEQPSISTQESSEVFDNDNELVIRLKKIRIEIAKEQKIQQLYIVYSNSTIQDIVNRLPVSIEELREIKGIGDKKITLFGNKIIEEVNKYVNSKISPELIMSIKNLRSKIVKFNHLNSDTDAFSDEVLYKIAVNKPKSLEDLKSIEGFNIERINMFGEYLLKRLSELNK